ncbi:hypothetical protein CDD83_6256 [Cordyceps sp. RAO-2017]|nr:hypothetical protein CDD83_6256 [Cordyceps sp. RAO-2017]
MSAKTIAIVGATGNQGKVVIDRLLQNATTKDQLKIRALTRDSKSSKSKTLEARGAGRIGIVDADVNNKASLEAALAGADYVFANLNSYLDMDGEVQQGKNVVDAAKGNNVKLFIWSTLPSFAAFTKGRYTNVRHAENKIQVQEYLATSGVAWVGASTSFFSDNFLWPNYVSLGEGGSYSVSSGTMEPDVKLPMTWLEKDLGPFVAALIEAHLKGDKSAPQNKAVVVAGFHASLRDVAAELSEQTGRPAKAVAGTDAGSVELAEMFSSYNDFGFYEGEEIPSSFVRENGIEHSTLREFVKGALVPALESRSHIEGSLSEPKTVSSSTTWQKL